jgi:hypothetical protein
MTIPIFPALSSDDPDIDTWMETASIDPTLRSGKMSGLITTRARYTRVPKKWDFEYAFLSDADKQILEHFEQDVNYGALPFYWKCFQEAYGVAARAKIAYTAGQIVHPSVPNGRSYQCIVSGTPSESNDPVWPITENTNVTDGPVTWQENSYIVRFTAPIQFQISSRIDYWKATISLTER